MEKDFKSNVFFSDNERFADIINGIGFDGVSLVRGKDLQELKIRKKLITLCHFGLWGMIWENMKSRLPK